MGRLYVSSDPTIRGGDPCVGGTGITVEAVAGMVWAGETVERVADDYDLTRHQVLVACWYAGSAGLPGPRTRGLHPGPLWRRRWGAWAAQVRPALWKVVDFDDAQVPDPPSKIESNDPIR